ncbi:phage holin, LLH family [Lactobacillus sp. ESL0701]|uniref:phage holin, LLH family n=1 Tax=Lactobacillus sp. ESL0701 TaxID=2983217 RepID=UPI0023F7F093|nr:phage holin, LLH family [Lactobacillus sp. ESL0701]MDF7672183.1 phage holin, LLH family [Lactobacillus sp. ESL0701]
MSVKDYLDLSYAGLVVVAIVAYVGVKVYGEHHTIKNKWVAEIPNLAAAFVHEAETTGGDGKSKMNAVINEVTRVLSARGVKIDPTIEAAIRAFAEKEVAKMNADKPDKTDAETPATADDFNEDDVKDETEKTVIKDDVNSGADNNA